MSYREKIAWLSLLAMAITIVPYLAVVAWGSSQEAGMPNLRQLMMFGIAAAAQAVFIGIGHLILRLRSPQEAKMPADERDEVIMRRSISYAYYALIFGMIVVGCVMPFSKSGWSIINAAIATIIASEFVHYGAVVVSYRRQA